MAARPAAITMSVMCSSEASVSSSGRVGWTRCDRVSRTSASISSSSSGRGSAGKCSANQSISADTTSGSTAPDFEVSSSSSPRSPALVNIPCNKGFSVAATMV